MNIKDDFKEWIREKEKYENFNSFDELEKYYKEFSGEDLFEIEGDSLSIEKKKLEIEKNLSKFDVYEDVLKCLIVKVDNDSNERYIDKILNEKDIKLQNSNEEENVRIKTDCEDFRNIFKKAMIYVGGKDDRAHENFVEYLDSNRKYKNGTFHALIGKENYLKFLEEKNFEV